MVNVKIINKSELFTLSISLKIRKSNRGIINAFGSAAVYNVKWDNLIIVTIQL